MEQWVEMPQDVQYAFNVYFKQGITRSAVKLYYELIGDSHFNGTEPGLQKIIDWSIEYNWLSRVKELDAEAYEQSKKMVQEEQIKAAKARIERARQMMEAGSTIIDRSDIEGLSPLDARALLATAKALIETGAKMERLEIGEKSENYEPPKPIESMDWTKNWKHTWQR